MIRFYIRAFVIAAIFFAQAAHAFDAFVVRDIRVEGLQRISLGTVLTYLPIKVGDRIKEQETVQNAIRSLYKQGFFHEVAIARDGNTLIVKVRERPSIAEIKFTGNHDISKDEINQAMKLIGLVEGRVFNPSTLDKVQQELRTQYFERGKYSAEIETTVTPLERNRVSIAIDIKEGEASRIQSINIVGNKVFSQEKLLNQLNLGTSAYSDSSKYSKQKLAADLEILRSYYLDRGYVDFKVVSTQVSITPNKQHLYITINISEGEQYTINKIVVQKTKVVPSDELESLLTFKAGDVFSRREIAASTDALRKRISEEGYAYASVEPTPHIDPNTKKVDIEFRIRPGSKVYVRRITISNNAKTRDDVIRREFRQLEGAILSSEKVTLSRQRLMRLGYFDSVNITESRVPGSPDQIDLNVDVVERASGTISGGISYSPEQTGIMINFGLQQDNFLGTGTNTSININEGEASNVYSFSFTNPYYTKSGVSRTWSIYSRSYDPTVQNLTNYSIDNAGASVSFGFPLNEYNSTSLGIILERSGLRLIAQSPTEYNLFESAYGDTYDLLYLTTGWRRDTRNNAIFATDGSRTQLNLKSTVPGSTLEFYKLSLNQKTYIPVGKRSTIALRAEFNYGGVYGSTADFPPFENFLSGGPESVRGFWANRLGPKSISSDGEGNDYTNYIGGAFETVASVEYLFPFKEDDNSTRMGLFMDVGNVFSDPGQYSASELRASVGIGFVWLTPIGALKLSYAKPIQYDPATDSLQPIQFTIGLPY
jgi:outer membrane protein insertion porin family